MPSNPTWRFFRAGGFDQVRLDTAAELLAIDQLDQKLWVALSCPVKGIEFDARTLTLVDSDADGQVRAPELIAAVRWVDERLKNKDVLTQKMPGVPLAAIRDDDETGQRICVAAREVLADVRASDGMVTVDATSAAQARYAEKALAAWEAQGAQARPLGDATEAAYAALVAVADKVDDWFVRCNLAAFDGRAADALNASAEAFTALGAVSLKSNSDGIAALPLAHVQAQTSLPLTAGINPAWADAMATLRTSVVLPLLGARDVLTAADWQSLKDQLAPTVPLPSSSAPGFTLPFVIPI